MTLDEMISVLEAARKGKRIECRHRYQRPGVDEQWGDVCAGGPMWDFSLFDYRPAPEPREWWLVVGDSDPRNVLYISHSRESAERAAKVNGMAVTCVREVLP